MRWLTSRFDLNLSRPLVMGIVNLTPDSFSDGGCHVQASQALRHCEQLLAEGADILDLGAESTRPGAQPVSLDEELNRLLPVLREAVRLGVPVSIDTYKPEVMRAALDVGADIVNDIWALRHPPARPGGLSAVDVVAAHPRCGVCVMHMHRDPQTMQLQPMQGSVVQEVLQFLKQRVLYLQAAGIVLDRISVDPGIGFGKTPEQNLSLLAHQAQLNVLGCPVLTGWSRKSTLGWVLGDGGSTASADAVRERGVASVTAALLAVQQGARIVRVHDVKETAQALAVWTAVQHSAASAPVAGVG